MRVVFAGFFAAMLVCACRSVPDGGRAELELSAYRQAVRSGSAGAAGADAVVRAELAGIDEPGQRTALAGATARRHHELALATSDPDEALAREEVAYLLLSTTCSACTRQKIPVLLHLAQLYTRRGDSAGLARCATRVGSVDTRHLTAEKLSNWPLLRNLAEIYEKVGDFARAAQIERSMLDAKLQILDASHPQVAASRARIAELERHALELPPVGAAPPDPAR